MPVVDVLAAVEDLQSRAARYDEARDYEAGRHQYPYATPGFRAKFAWILKAARANLCPAVVSAFTDRVELEGWDGTGAAAAQELTANGRLRRVLNLAVREAWTVGDAYVLVWPNARGDMVPRFHRADQVTFAPDPEDPGAFAWVTKLWVDADHVGHASVYYPDRLERWETVAGVRTSKADVVTWPAQENAWRPATDDDGPEVAYASVGVDGIPWAHLAYDPNDDGGHGHSVLRDVIPLQDGLNHALHSVLVNVEDYAEPLRALLGFTPSKELDPTTGRQKDVPIQIDPTTKKMYAVTGEGSRLVQLEPPDSQNILAVMESFGSWIARIVGIPASDVVPDLGNVPSGTALRVLSARRTAAVRDFTTDITPDLAHLMHLLGVQDATPRWVDPAPTDETERWDVAVKRDGIGFPLVENLKAMGWTEEDAEAVVTAGAASEAAVGREARARFEQGQVAALGQ
ncbi:phage portal protein [Brachybacterium nesterenkovii]|uniref:phage portal protein n=1 Tax=Brachybacterium nesterenkovii TaxID=47847 RepID=UPI00321A7C08